MKLPGAPLFFESVMSLRKAINAFCLECRHDDVFAVGNCEKTECKLHSVRPNQVLQGKVQESYDLSELKQSALDALQFTGLKEKSYV